MSESSFAEIYKEFKAQRININKKIKPYIFSDSYMKSHSPIIVYESTDYLQHFNNWAIYDKLQMQNNYIKYSYCEMYGTDIILLTGSILLGSIFSLLIIINRVLKTLNKDGKTAVELSIKANEKTMLRMQKPLMDITDFFCESYYMVQNKEHIVKYTFKNINHYEINDFTNRFLELFVSENPKSTTPFLSAAEIETRKFYDLLLTYENYLMIEN